VVRVLPTIIVPFKQIVDIKEIKVDPSTQTPITVGIPRKISDVDKNALEEAIKLKEKHGGNVIAITMGPSEAKTALREALAMGTDEAYLLSDPIFENSDTLATARVLAKAIEKLGGFDLIICGEMTLDGLSAQVGPRLAELLDIPQITYVRKVTIDGNKVIAEKDLEEEYETVEAQMPVLLTVTREINEPRIPSLRDIMKASRKGITTWTASDLGISKEEVGAEGSAVQILKVTVPKVERKGVIVKAETVEEAAEELVKMILKEGVLRG